MFVVFILTYGQYGFHEIEMKTRFNKLVGIFFATLKFEATFAYCARACSLAEKSKIISQITNSSLPQKISKAAMLVFKVVQ